MCRTSLYGGGGDSVCASGALLHKGHNPTYRPHVTYTYTYTYITPPLHDSFAPIPRRNCFIHRRGEGASARRVVQSGRDRWHHLSLSVYVYASDDYLMRRGRNRRGSNN